MSIYSQAPPPSAPTVPPRPFHLAAHTASATVLTEKLIHGTISQRDYDAQILSTTIKSAIMAASVPIIMTTDDTLPAILAQAARGLDMSPPNAASAKPYLWCSTKLLEFMGTPVPVSGDSILLDQKGLKNLFTILKEGDLTDRLLIACEGEVVEADYLKIVVTREESREDDTPAVRGSRPTAPSEGRRAGELWSEVERSAQNSVQGHHRNPALRRTTGFYKASEQHGTESDPRRAKEKEGREPGWRS